MEKMHADFRVYMTMILHEVVIERLKRRRWIEKEGGVLKLKVADYELHCDLQIFFQNLGNGMTQITTGNIHVLWL